MLECFGNCGTVPRESTYVCGGCSVLERGKNGGWKVDREIEVCSKEMLLRYE